MKRGLQAESIPVAEAAAKAAARYVWDESYKKGVQEGWAAGWTAAFSGDGLSISGAQDHCLKLEDEGPAPRLQNATASDADEDIPEFEMDAAWAELFASGERRRAEKRRREDVSKDPQARPVSLELGGSADAARAKEAVRLYGEDAEAILETETEMKAAFDSLVACESANLWPVISIRECEPLVAKK